jgi:hypothetical protein
MLLLLGDQRLDLLWVLDLERGARGIDVTWREAATLGEWCGGCPSRRSSMR